MGLREAAAEFWAVETNDVGSVEVEAGEPD